MSSSRHKVADVTIVSGLGLAQFRDDDLAVEEPNAASTAGHKPTRRDLLEKKCSEFMASMNLPGSSTAGHGFMPPPQNASSRRPTAKHSVGYHVEAPAATNKLQTTSSQPVASPATSPRKHETVVTTNRPGQQSAQCASLNSNACSFPPADGVPLQATHQNIPLNQMPFNHQKQLGISDKYAPKNSGFTGPPVTVPLPSNRVTNKENEPPLHTQFGEMNNISEVLAEMSPPKSFAQRLREAKSQTAEANSHEANQWQAHGSCSTAIGESFRALHIANGNSANCQRVSCEDNTGQAAPQAAISQHGSRATNSTSFQARLGDAPKTLPKIILETARNSDRQGCPAARDSSGSLGLLSSSVLRARPGDSSETWLLQEPSLQLHRSVMEYEEGTNPWECPGELNYTASDVPWNQEELRAAILPTAPADVPTSSDPPFGMAPATSSPDGGGMDFSGEAAELAALMGNEQFGELNLEELERDEQQQCRSLPPALEEGGDSGSSEMTGLYGIDEITVRESWLGPRTGTTTSSGGGGSVRRMRVDEYLQAGSLALGSLSGHDSRPSFGLHSAPPLPRSASATPQLSPLDEASDGSFNSMSDAGRQEAWEDYMKPPSPPQVSTSSYRNRPDPRYQNPEYPKQQECDAAQPRPSPAPERGSHSERPSSERPALAPVREDVGGVRTRGDGGSLGEHCNDNETAGSSTLKIDDLCTSSLSSTSKNHQGTSMTSALKAQLARSSSVNVASSNKQSVPNQVSTYGSLGRAPKAVITSVTTSSASTHNLHHSKSQTDVSRSSGGYQATPAVSSQDLRGFLARRNLDNIGSAITDMSDNISPQHARERLLHAVADDTANNASSLQQDSTTLFDASVDIEALRRQKELIKQRISRHPSLNVHQPGRCEVKNGADKSPLQESKSTPLSQEPGHDKLSGNSSQQYPHSGQAQRAGTGRFLEPFPPNHPRAQMKMQADDLFPQRDTQTEFPQDRHQPPPQWSNGVNNTGRLSHDPNPRRSWQPPGRDHVYREDEGSDDESLDDTVRLEPCSPSVTLSSSFSETLRPEQDTHCAELEDAPGLQRLSVSACRPNTGDSVCRSPPVMVEGCVVGVATWLSVPLYNPTSHYIRLWATVVNETLDDRPVPNSSSSLLFKQGCLLEPGQNVVWALGICGRNEGTVKCVLKLQLEHVDSKETLITHVVPVFASINLPQVTIGDSNTIDVGQVPEGYLHEHSFDVHNKSERDLAVIIGLVQTSSTSVFFFKAEANVRQISEAEIACVLPPGRSTFPLKVMAPSLSGTDGEVAKDSVNISCKLLVKMDSPVMPRPMLASECVSVDVVAIHLHVSRFCQSLKLQAPSNGHASTPLVLKNLSCIPLQLSFKWNSGNSGLSKESLVVVPESFVIQPNSQSSPVVVFTPLGAVTQFTATVAIVVEPYGIEYEIPVTVSSFSAPDKKILDKAATTAHKTKGSSSKDLTSDPKEAQSDSRKVDVPPRPTGQPNHIEASRSRLVFGCVDHGNTVAQKLSFYNRDVADMTLRFSITGSSSFTVVEPAQASSVVLPASGIGTLMVGFSPAENDSAYSAVLVCKPRGQQGNRVKYSIQLQGYGGCGALQPADREVCVPRAAPGCPAIVRLALANTGLRALCLAVRPFADEDCSVSLIPKDSSGSILVQPDELVLGAAESQDLVVLATVPSGSGEASARGAPDASGRVLLATLLITYCEELLRHRYRRRLAGGCSKTTAASRGSPIDWDTGFRGEKLAAKAEEDSLPSQAEDGKVFLAACRQIKVPVYTTFRTASPEASVTCFSPLVPDMTLCDTTLAYEDSSHHGTRKPLSSSGVREGNDLNKPATPLPDTSGNAFLFNVEAGREPSVDRMMMPPPPPKSVSGSDRSGNKYGTSNSTKSLASSNSSEGVSKKGQDSVLRDSIGVIAVDKKEDLIQSSTINRERQNSGSKDRNYSSFPERDGDFSKATSGKLAVTAGAAAVEAPCLEVFPKELSLESGGTAAIVAVNKTKQEQTLQVVCSETCLKAEPRVASVGPHGSISVQLSLKPDQRLPNALLLKVLCNGQESLVQVCCTQQAEVQELPDTATAGKLCSSGLEISPMALSFPITAVAKQSHVKLSLKNLSTSVKQVLASVTPGAFVVKHPHFQVKVGHFVNIPVYFRPRSVGEHRGRLRLVVGRDAPVEVALSGSCV